MSETFEITYSCPVRTWRRQQLIDAMLEDLLYGQTFRVLPSRQVTVHLTTSSFRSNVCLIEERNGRAWFSVRVPKSQFADRSLTSAIIQLWGNVLDYGGIRLENVDMAFLAFFSAQCNRPTTHILAGVRGPLLGTVLKPSWRISLDQKIDMACEFVELGGVFVKEDETYAPSPMTLAEEWGSIQASLDSISDKNRGLGIYVPHITGLMCDHDLIQKFKNYGIRACMISFLVAGLAETQRFACQAPADFLLWGHRVGFEAIASSMSRDALVQFAILAGLDTVHVGTPFVANKNSMTACAEVVRTLRTAASIVGRDIWPVFSKTTRSIIPELLTEVGNQVILLGCGDIRHTGYPYPDRKKVKAWIETANSRI